jgi:hypothetical protein
LSEDTVFNAGGETVTVGKDGLKRQLAAYQYLCARGYTPPVGGQHNHPFSEYASVKQLEDAEDSLPPGWRQGDLLAMEMWEDGNGTKKVIGAVALALPNDKAEEAVRLGQVKYFSPELGPLELDDGTTLPLVIKKLDVVERPHQKTGATHILASEAEMASGKSGVFKRYPGGGRMQLPSPEEKREIDKLMEKLKRQGKKLTPAALALISKQKKFNEPGEDEEVEMANRDDWISIHDGRSWTNTVPPNQPRYVPVIKNQPPLNVPREKAKRVMKPGVDQYKAKDFAKGGRKVGLENYADKGQALDIARDYVEDTLYEYRSQRDIDSLMAEDHDNEEVEMGMEFEPGQRVKIIPQGFGVGGQGTIVGLDPNPEANRLGFYIVKVGRKKLQVNKDQLKALSDEETEEVEMASTVKIRDENMSEEDEVEMATLPSEEVDRNTGRKGKPSYDSDFKAGFIAGTKAFRNNDQISIADGQKAYRRVSGRHGSWWVDGFGAAIDMARGAFAQKGVGIARKMGLRLSEDDSVEDGDNRFEMADGVKVGTKVNLPNGVKGTVEKVRGADAWVVITSGPAKGNASWMPIEDIKANLSDEDDEEIEMADEIEDEEDDEMNKKMMGELSEARNRIARLEAQRDAATFSQLVPATATVEMSDDIRSLLFKAYRRNPAAWDSTLGQSINVPRGRAATLSEARIAWADPIGSAAAGQPIGSDDSSIMTAALREAGGDHVKAAELYKINKYGRG